MKLVAYIDGSSSGNPGQAGYGVVIRDAGGTVLKRVGRYIGVATNNVAEYQGLIGCLKLAEEYHPCSLVVFSDSQLLVNQIKGIYRVKQPHLKVLHAKTMTAIQSGPDAFEIHHIPREENNEADGLARKAVECRLEIEGE